MHVVVAGALGLIGRAVIKQLGEQRDVRVVGLSRRGADATARGQRAAYRAVDLTDARAARETLADLRDATHLVFAAWLPGSTTSAAAGAREVDANVAMLRNAVEALEAASARFSHVTLMQGSKAYGMHFGRIHEPAREDDPRTMPPNFYYDQEDLLRERSRGKNWSWTIFRPVTVFGFAAGSPINVLTALGVYAAICKQLGLPLRYPGTDAGLRVLRNAVDAQLIGEAVAWAASNPACRGETFNLANGDLYTWQRLWPRVAEVFRMPLAEPQALPLVDVMRSHEATWDAIRARHELVFGYRELAEASWPTAEGHFKRDYDGIVHPLKSREFGFQGFRDTQKTVEQCLLGMIRDKVLPPPD